MLVISRKKSESLIIGDNIEIVISEISPDKVKLCINAPKEISIMRKELLETSDLNQEASTAPNKNNFEQFKSLTKGLTKELAKDLEEKKKAF